MLSIKQDKFTAKCNQRYLVSTWKEHDKTTHMLEQSQSLSKPSTSLVHI